MLECLFAVEEVLGGTKCSHFGVTTTQWYGSQTNEPPRGTGVAEISRDWQESQSHVCVCDWLVTHIVISEATEGWHETGWKGRRVEKSTNVLIGPGHTA